MVHPTSASQVQRHLHAGLQRKVCYRQGQKSNTERAKKHLQGTRTVVGVPQQNKTKFVLPKRFIQEKFSAGFIANIKHLGRQKAKGSYVPDSLGASRRHTVTVGVEEEGYCEGVNKALLRLVPAVHYRGQKHGERT